jgi:thiamine biosynthesis lipoprotein
VRHTLSVLDQAVATSGGYGTRLDAAGRYTHLIDPRTGRTAPAFESVTVVAPSATQADALSTALALLPRSDVPARLALLRTQPGCRAICIDNAGQVSELS